ncbi:hypothetical protein [Bacteroides uniformis]|nr:hypothetical protein [Bacteroides uniformis]MCS2415982.1 hypothetical protein [Bacteroides uniformis]
MNNLLTAMKQSLDDRKQSCSWPLGVSLSIAFTDEVRPRTYSA